MSQNTPSSSSSHIPEPLVTTKNAKKNPLTIIKKACKKLSGNCDELLKGLAKQK